MKLHHDSFELYSRTSISFSVRPDGRGYHAALHLEHCMAGLPGACVAPGEPIGQGDLRAMQDISGTAMPRRNPDGRAQVVRPRDVVFLPMRLHAARSEPPGGWRRARRAVVVWPAPPSQCAIQLQREEIVDAVDRSLVAAARDRLPATGHPESVRAGDSAKQPGSRALRRKKALHLQQLAFAGGFRRRACALRKPPATSDASETRPADYR